MTRTMNVSVVIPARNGERFLRQALDSALGQVRPAWEVLLVDDASTDRTADIARSAPYAGRVRYARNERATGFVDAWNRAVALATGEFVTILHQDDLLHPEYLWRIERAMERFPGVEHLYAASLTIDEKGTLIAQPPAPHTAEPAWFTGREYARRYLGGVLGNRHIHRCPGVTTRRRLLLDRCAYRAEAGQIADDDFFLRVGAFTDVVGIAQPLASYREHRESTTARLDSLTFALARDYIFQTRWHDAGNTLLDSADITGLHRQAVRFVNRLLVEGLRLGREDWVRSAAGFREELELLVPGLMGRELPGWARPVWGLAFDGRVRQLAARSYVRMIGRAVRARDIVRPSGRS